MPTLIISSQKHSYNFIWFKYFLVTSGVTQLRRDTTIHFLPVLCPTVLSKTSAQRGGGQGRSACRAVLQVADNEGSHFWLRTCVWFFGPDHRQPRRHCMASRGKATSPHQVWRAVQSRTQVCHILSFLDQVPSFLGLFVWGHGQRSSSDASWILLTGKGEGNLDDTFPHSDSKVLGTFPLLSLSPCLATKHTPQGQ